MKNQDQRSFIFGAFGCLALIALLLIGSWSWGVFTDSGHGIEKANDNFCGSSALVAMYFGEESYASGDCKLYYHAMEGVRNKWFLLGFSILPLITLSGLIYNWRLG